MFTPRLTPTQSPFLKDEEKSGRATILVSNTNLTLLRQILNDSNVITEPVLTNPFESILKKEVREKGLYLILTILRDNRASTEAFHSFVNNTNGGQFVCTLKSGFLESIKLDQGDLIEMYLNVLSMLVTETGREGTALTGIVYGLTKCILNTEFGHSAACILSSILEHPIMKDDSLAALMTIIIKEGPDLKIQLMARLWEMVGKDDLMAELVILRLLLGFGEGTGRSANNHTWEMVNRVKKEFSLPSRFPFTYLHLCILHQLLFANGQVTESLGSKSLITTSNNSGGGSSSNSRWFTSKSDPETLIDQIILILLDLLLENLLNIRDSYQHEMLCAIITNALVDRPREPNPKILNLLTMLKDYSSRRALPLTVQLDIGLLWNLFMNGYNGNPIGSSSRTKIILEPTSYLFTLPLIHAEMFQLLTKKFKNHTNRR